MLNCKGKFQSLAFNTSNLSLQKRIGWNSQEHYHYKNLKAWLRTNVFDLSKGTACSASDLLSCVLRMSDVNLLPKLRAVWFFTNVAQKKVVLK